MILVVLPIPCHLAIPLYQSSTTYTPRPQAHSPYHIFRILGRA
nr:MAG TPA: hypothetical protein [Caudoviricetes sp.]